MVEAAESMEAAVEAVIVAVRAVEAVEGIGENSGSSVNSIPPAVQLWHYSNIVLVIGISNIVKMFYEY